MNSFKALHSAFSALGCFICLGLLSYGLGHSFNGMSPIGDLIAPSRGFWRHQPTRSSDLEARLRNALANAGMKPVELEVDLDGVPHLNASDDTSLYFAQGFVTAYYRLWQMDFLSRITAGEVSELLGEAALPIDRFFRRMRLPAAAHAVTDLVMADPFTRGPLTSYTQGVNARIGEIDISSIPVEYRLFGILPDVWSEDRAAHLMKFMTWELTGRLDDFKLTKTKAKLPADIFELLFPLNSKVSGTILGNTVPIDGRPSKSQVGFQATPAPAPSVARHRYQDIPSDVLPEPANGSNNWAVPARMMSNRRALLANDLHLGYTLPALWFPMQLTTPTMNVYGASLPGAPGIIVGFTETMGWAVTNGTDDVLDWYSLRFRDANRQEYLFEDTWRPVMTRDELIHVAGGKTEVIQTRETHLGPIVFEEQDAAAIIDVPSGLAVQWMGFRPSNILKNFLLLNRATSARDCVAALKGYVAPSQNFVCADRTGKIVFQHAGVFPDRKGGDGRVISEVANDLDLWQGTLLPEENPSKETSTDLIVTANQAPFNGENLHKYGWFFVAPYRALQIRSRIEAKKIWKPEEMIEIQADTISRPSLSFKQLVLSEKGAAPLKEALQHPACADGSTNESLLSRIEKWNGDHSPESTLASLMHRWLKKVEEQVWTRIVGPQTDSYWPSTWRFFELIQANSSAMKISIWDDLTTPNAETLNQRLEESLKLACKDLRETSGSEKLPRWDSYQTTEIRHSGRIPGLGQKVSVGGAADSIFANKGTHGPTWKMIVTFEDPPRAWAMIPGGASGDPSSMQYDDKLDAWARGEMRPVKFNMRKAK